MRLATIRVAGVDVAAVVDPDGSFVPVTSIASELPSTVLGLLQLGLTADLRERLVVGAARVDDAQRIASETAHMRPLLRPGKVLGIGLNYRDHAADLSAPFPETPASFFKVDHTLIGPGDDIVIPQQSHRTTSEAELGLVFGQRCWQVEESAAMDYVAGVCAILDQTAEDILAQNPRFLTRSKNFPTFLSLGETLVTIDEVMELFGDLASIRVATVLNGETVRENSVDAMAYGPRELVSFHSEVMPFDPGDIISTGTPGAAKITAGDVVSCEIEGLVHLSNPVKAA